MAGMSLDKLNELLDRALRELHMDGLSVVTYQEPKPWLPESYWAQVARREAETLIDLAKHKEYMRHERMLSDRRREQMTAADLMAEWDKDIPRLQGGDTRMLHAGWGQPMGRSGGTLKRPYEGNPQPSYDYECYQCGRPITKFKGAWVDHSNGEACDHVMMLDWIDMDGIAVYHQPKPWHGEEEDGDEDDY